MSCTSPINIDSNTSENCLLKCSYFYNYSASTARISNEGVNLKVLYDGGGDILYNKEKYNPESLLIYAPSLHTYDGAVADGEILITHTATSGGRLIVSIPIISGAGTNAAAGSKIIADIINNAPDTGSTDEGGIVSYNIADFNLNYIVPKSPYYSYAGTFPYSCTDNAQYSYIVFNKKDNPLFIDEDTLSKLQSLITSPDTTIYASGVSYYNATGTTSNGFDGDGQIYIDCQPTGEDGEILYSEDSDGNALPLGGASEYADKATTWVINSIYFVIGLVLMLIIYWCARKWIFKKVHDNPFADADKG